MKDKKRQYEIYSFLDYDGLAAHFGRMSEKGWLFEGSGPFYRIYSRVEPKRRSFYISYFPKASEFDPGLGEEQQEFADFCRRTGWRLAGTAAQMQVFYNESENPVPIETDPALEVETINRAAWKSYLPTHLFLLAVAIFELLTMGWRLFTDALDFLSRASSLFTVTTAVILLAVSLVELTSYFLWLRRARKAARVGEWTPSVSHRRFQKAFLAVLLVDLAVYLIDMAVSGNRLLLAAMLLMTSLILVSVLVTLGVKALMKRLGVPGRVNRTVTFLTAVVLSVVIVSFSVFTLVGFVDRLPWLRGAGGVPLELSELYGGEEGDMYTVTRRDGSLLMTRMESYQRPDRSTWHSDETLEYTVYASRFPALTDLAIRKLLEKNMKDAMEDGYVYIDHYEPVDPSPWHAQRAYRRLISWMSDGEEAEYMTCWFLDYGGTVVSLKLGSEPTQEQMDLIAQRLGNVKGD